MQYNPAYVKVYGFIQMQHQPCRFVVKFDVHRAVYRNIFV